MTKVTKVYLISEQIDKDGNKIDFKKISELLWNLQRQTRDIKNKCVQLCWEAELLQRLLQKVRRISEGERYSWIYVKRIRLRPYQKRKRPVFFQSLHIFQRHLYCIQQLQKGNAERGTVCTLF